MKLVIIGPNIKQDCGAGRESLSSVNEMLISSLPFLSVAKYIIPNPGRAPILRRALGWLDGLSPSIIDECEQELLRLKPDCIYIDGSNYGYLTRAVKRLLPHSKVIVFFHNIETCYYWGNASISPSAKSLSMILSNFISEYMSVKYSDYRIALTRRDSFWMKRLFSRVATHIIPLTTVKSEDAHNALYHGEITADHPFALFVGSTNYSNVHGLLWFCKNVLPQVSCKLVVVGRGFHAISSRFSAFSRVEVVGSVKDLSPWYQIASFVVAPLFMGSGMKTKVGEALMYGCPIVGTSEAFVGYENIQDQCGFICNTKFAYISAINKILSNQKVFDREFLRSLHHRYFSTSSNRELYRSLFVEILATIK